MSGTITGRASGERVQARARGDAFSADLSLTTRGNRQSVAVPGRREPRCSRCRSRSASRQDPAHSIIQFAHVLFGKPVPTFPGHALDRRSADLGECAPQLDRERSEPVLGQRLRSPALPACSSTTAAAPTPLAPTACAAPFSLCEAAATAARSPSRDAHAGSRAPRRLRYRGISPRARRSPRDRHQASSPARSDRSHRGPSTSYVMAVVFRLRRSRASAPAWRAAGRCSPASPDRRPYRPRGSAPPRPSWRWR